MADLHNPEEPQCIIKSEGALVLDADNFEYIEEADIISEDEHVQQEQISTHDMEIYKCSSCDVVIHSVEEHVRDCHQHEDVVIETEEDKLHDGSNPFGFEEIVTERDKLIQEQYCFKCKICSTELKSARSLKLHLKMHEAKQDAHQGTEFENHCHLCNRVFSSSDHLRLHVVAHSDCQRAERVNTVNPAKQSGTSGTGYPCSYCGREFKRPFEKVKHERIHTGERPYSCETCGKRFRVSGCLTLHRRTHEDSRPFVCPNCKKRFKVQSAYNHHLKTHSSERHYKCTFCTKSFKTAVQLNGHTKSHTKPFSCSVCNRRFGTLYCVHKHMQVHQKTDKLAYSCDICGANYARAFALRDHRKDQHGVEIQPNQVVESNDGVHSLKADESEVITEDSFQFKVESEEIIEEELVF